MAAVESLCRLNNINLKNFSNEENLILEAEFYYRICEQLKELFKIQYKDYFRIMKFNKEMEDAMMEERYVRCVINDIISTQEYSLLGIASYTYSPEDVIYEVATGKNTNPSSQLMRKIIELHRSVRPDLYRDMIKKIITDNPELK